jgi:mono/diheme cytochrome c family protein
MNGARASTALVATLLLVLLVSPATPVRAGDERQARRAPRAAAKAVVANTGMLGTNDGAQIYAQICQGCHMPGGRGAVGAGRYPAFAGSPAIASAPYMVVTILNGRRNMPAFRKPAGNGNFFPPVYLTDAQVASVVNYIRTNFGNRYPDAITAEEVAKLAPPAAPPPKP